MKEVREGKPFTNANLSIFYRNLKCSEGTALAAIQEKGVDDLKGDGERILQEIATEQCFTVTYVDIEEKSTTDKFHTIVQAWLPDGYIRIFRLYVFGPSGFWNMAPLR